jgi:integrase
VVTLLEAITPRYRAAVLLAAWCGLRRGEIIGLRLEGVNVGSATVTVRRNRVELLENDRAAFDADPKTDAGKWTVAIPPHVVPVLAEHMAIWAGPDRVFVGRNGQPMRGDAVRQAFGRARRRRGCLASGSMICVIPARLWRRLPARRRFMVWRTAIGNHPRVGGSHGHTPGVTYQLPIGPHEDPIASQAVTSP